jgi:hypothetical protein
MPPVVVSGRAVTDALDLLIGPGSDLLERVDAALIARGLPAGHPISELLHRLGALPMDALSATSARRAAPLRAAASELRQTAEAYERQRDRLAEPAGWAGAAGERFAAHQRALVTFLGGTADATEVSLAGRVRATAAYLDDVADWVDRSRLDMARAVAEALGSAEAVGLRATDDPGAAAILGARVLAAAAAAYESGEALAGRWSGRLDEVPYHPPTVEGSSAGETRLVW